MKMFIQKFTSFNQLIFKKNDFKIKLTRNAFTIHQKRNWRRVLFWGFIGTGLIGLKVVVK
jgi:hypothetical protein